MAEDVLSRGISMLVEPMASPRGFQTPSYVLYADDILIFCRGTKQNLLNLIYLFNRYAEAFGQLISYEKSKFLAGAMSTNRIAMISNILGFNARHLPFIYLGVPLFKRKPRKIHFQSIMDGIKTN